MYKERDSKLVVQSRQGDRQAMEALVSYYERPVYSLCYRLLGNREDAGDVTQKVFLKAFRTIHRLDETANLFCWLYRIAIHEAASYLKHSNRHQTVNESVTDISGSETNPEQSRLNDQVQQLMMELPADLRAVLALKHFAGCDCGQIAEILQIPEKTVTSRLYTARQLLKNEQGFTIGMIDTYLDKLVNQQLDYEISTRDQEHLNQLLAESKEARDQQTASQRLDDLLSSLAPQLPPLALHEKILDTIEPPARHGFGLFRNRSINTITRLGYILVAGLLLGLALYVFNPNMADRQMSDHTVGTLVPPSAHGKDATVDEFSFAISNLSSRVKLLEVGGKLHVDLAMDAKVPVEIELDVISGNMEFAELDLANGWRGHLTEGSQSVFLHNMGHQQLTMQISKPDLAPFTRHKTRIKVSYFIRGNRVQQHLLVDPR